MGTVESFEHAVYSVAARFAYIQRVVTLDKTANAIKLRLYVTAGCFVQIYANVRKKITSYALVLGETRIYGRNCDGGTWHRHPYEDPESHDFSPEGSREVSLNEFLIEVQQILEREGIL
jgi:hypothetical protein